MRNLLLPSLVCLALYTGCSSAEQRARNDAGTRDAAASSAPTADAALPHDASSAGAPGHDAAVSSKHEDAGSAHDASADSGPALPALKNPCRADAHYGAALTSSSLAATKITDTFYFTEGPVWVASENALYFSDVQAGAGADNVQPSNIQRFTPPNTFTLWQMNSGSNGMALSADAKQLIACTHDTQSVSSFELAGKLRKTLVADYQGKHFHSPNDVAVRSDGTLYFTDPNYQQGNRSTNIVDKTRVYRLAPSGVATVVDENLQQPNGIALSPDETLLYVDSQDGKVSKYAVLRDGSTGPAQPFVSGLQSPDGMTMDCAGNLYVAEFNTGLVHVYAPDNHELGTISASANTTNLAFGGSDAKTLFITSGARSGSSGLYSIQLGVPGLPN